jgi:hypothetical protein
MSCALQECHRLVPEQLSFELVLERQRLMQEQHTGSVTLFDSCWSVMVFVAVLDAAVLVAFVLALDAVEGVAAVVAAVAAVGGTSSGTTVLPAAVLHGTTLGKAAVEIAVSEG